MSDGLLRSILLSEGILMFKQVLASILSLSLILFPINVIAQEASGTVRIRNFEGLVTNTADHLIKSEQSPYMLNAGIIDGRLQPLPGFTRVSATPLTAADKDIQYAYIGDRHYRYNSGLQYENGLGGTAAVSYWLLNDDTTTTTDGMAVNSLTENGTVTSTSSGVFGNAHVFNASADFWDIADASQTGLDFTSSFSGSAWVKVTASTSRRTILSKSDSYHFTISGNTYTLQLRLGGTDLTVSTETVPLGTWTHVAFVFDNTADTVAYYINGALSNTVTGVTQTPSDNANNFRVGSSASYAAIGVEAVNTYMDDIGVWNSALSATQINQIYTYGILGFVSAVGTFASISTLPLPAAPTVVSYTVRSLGTSSATCNATADQEFKENISDEGTYAFFQTYYVPSQGVESQPSAISSVAVAH